MLIISDLDGVLADFTSAACQVHGAPASVDRWNFYEDWGITAGQFWAPIHDLGDDFYGRWIKPYPWCDEYLRMIAEFGDVIVMSFPSNHPAGYAGKKIWLDKYAPGLKLIVGGEKHLLAASDRILIDDYEKNCLAFGAAGGTAIEFPQPWNSNFGNIADRVGFVRGELETISKGNT